ncbi:MAG: sugar phosphate isomerase/epimerase [Pirellulaceae bacterium]
MMRFSVSELSTLRWSFEEDIEFCVQNGIRALGIWRPKLSDFGEERGIELLREHEMAVSSVSWAGGFTGNEHLNHNECIEDGIEAVRIASAARAGCLLVHTGPLAGHIQTHAFRLARMAIDELAGVAHDLDVTIALEPMPSCCCSDWTFLNDLDLTMEFISSIRGGGVKLVFDTYQWGNHPDVLARLPELVRHIGLVQLGDARKAPERDQSRCPLGAGILPLREVLQSLHEAGYTGFYELEVHGEEMQGVDYCSMISQSRAVYESLVAVGG